MSAISDYIEQNETDAKDGSRSRVIVRASVIGIAANVLLAAFKAAVGLLSGSIAVVLDAVNNLSDAASSVITIIGTRLAARQPDKKHPFGYGRIEYLSALIIALIVLYAGVTSFVESVKAILHPEKPEYSAVSLVILAVGVAVKLLLGRYVRRTGERVDSDALIDSGKDAQMDAVISVATIVAALIFLASGLSLEAWLGAIIAAFIIRSGVGMLRETLSRILGERADADKARAIRDEVISFPQVSGAYDLVLNDYGPDTMNGSIHIEVPDTMTADALDALIRDITMRVFMRHRVVLTAIGVYSVNTKDAQVAAMRENVRRIALACPGIRELHGFYLEADEKAMRFDLVVGFDVPDRRKAYRDALDAVQQAYPDLQLRATMDTDFCEA